VEAGRLVYCKTKVSVACTTLQQREGETNGWEMWFTLSNLLSIQGLIYCILISFSSYVMVRIIKKSCWCFQLAQYLHCLLFFGGWYILLCLLKWSADWECFPSLYCVHVSTFKYHIVISQNALYSETLVKLSGYSHI